MTDEPKPKPTLSHTDGDGCLCAKCVLCRAMEAAYQDGTTPEHTDPAVVVLESAFAAREAELRERMELAESRLLRAGYRRSCDIAPCNCGDQWAHGGHADERLYEIGEALEYENGKTILQRVQSTVEKLSTALAEQRALREALRELVRWADKYMTYHSEKFYDGERNERSGLWPAISAAKGVLAANPPTDEDDAR